MKKLIAKLIERKRAEIAELEKRSEASTDAAEVREIGKTLKALRDEINELEKGAEGEDNTGDNGDDNGDGAGATGNEPDNARASIPTDAVLRNGVVVGTFGATKSNESNLAYRSAFMEFVLRGTPIPAELRADENTHI